MEINIDKIKEICWKTVSQMDYSEFELLDSIRLKVKLQWLEQEKKHNELKALNKKQQLFTKLEKKTENKKLQKREIDSQESETIYWMEMEEIKSEFNYKLYKALHEEIIEKCNAYKKFIEK